MMEGKIKIDNLSISQRQFNFDDNINDNNIIFNNDNFNNNVVYDQISRCTKIYRTIFFILFGNVFYIPKGFDITNNCFLIALYGLLMIALFFQLIYLNIIIFIILLISLGFKRFIVEFEHLEDLYVKKFAIIIISSLTIISSLVYPLWGELIEDSYIDYKSALKIFIFFLTSIIHIIIIFPLQLFRNILILLIDLIIQGFSGFIEDLNSEFTHYFRIDFNDL